MKRAMDKIMYKKVIVLGIVSLIAGGIVYGFSDKKHDTNQSTILETVAVNEGPIECLVSTTGSVSSNLDIEIKCKASGEIIQLPFDISDPVEKGDLLLEIDPIDEERNVRQSEASLAIANARLEQARLNLVLEEKSLVVERKRLEANLKSMEAKAQEESARAKRMKELLQKKLTSQEECETASTSEIQAAVNLETARIEIEDLKIREQQLAVKREEVKSNEAQVEGEEIALSISTRRLSETKVFSPIAGTISAKDVQIGQIVSSGITNVGGGTAVMVLSDLSHIYVYADVDESDIGQVKIGQSAEITVDSFPKMKFHGEVVRIAVQGENVSNVVTFEVKIEILDDKKELLKPQMTANIDILIDRREKALLLPAEAVSIKQGKSMVTVLNPDGIQEKREISTGITDFDNIEIVEGLQLGDTVLRAKNETESSWNKSEKGMFPPPPPPQ